MRNTTLHTALMLLLALSLVGCGSKDAEQSTAASADTSAGASEAQAGDGDELTVTDEELAGNPFLEAWDTPFGVQPFDRLADEHYMPAFKYGVLELRKEIAAIVDNPEPATFENTILAMELSGETLTRVLLTFSALTGTELNDNLRELQTQIWPMYSRETDAITLNNVLWQRVQSVYEQRESLGLDEQQMRLLELTHRGFVRQGAALPEDIKAEVTEINAELSELSTKFAQNLLAETKGFTIEITDEADTAGLSDTFKANLWDEDKQAWVLGLDRSIYETFMTQSENRALRARMFDGYRLRATTGERDNGPIAVRSAQLRAQRAELMGYDSHAHYELATSMAKTPDTVEDFLLRVWRAGLAQAKAEREDMREMIGDAFEFAGHDWWHYSERVRKARYDLDENALKPYFDLQAVSDGAFSMANRLFGLTFEAADVPTWNDVVTAYNVRDDDGSHLGIFMFDMYARDSKRGGAWMNSYRVASNINGEEVRPVVTNNMNLTAPPAGEPTLMRFSEVETFFHEFGHGLHGIMTQIDYPTFSGVDGPRDYTEFPAQILEHWTSQPQMLEEYAKHYETGEVIPDALVERLLAAANHNQGFATTEYVAASLLDLRWHMLSADEAAEVTDARAFEQAVLAEYGLIDEIEPRYRSQYFSHIFAGGYSSRYYAYLWSEILDADGFNAFLEAGDIFDPEIAARLKKWIYQAGGLKEADELYRNFRGADPSIEPLLRGRGFATDEPTSSD
ncbi:MAG: M3 family metallopeptidase [Pseudomonadota bacterium]